MSRVGEKIKRAREENKMTQKQLAKKLGVSESFINEVEVGRKIINENMITKVSKVLNKNINDIGMSVEEEAGNSREVPSVYDKQSKTAPKEEVKDIWNKAFGDVMRNVPVYDYTLKNLKGYREMAVHSNKIEGFNQDKVFFLEISDEDMAGYRIQKGDIAFCAAIKEIENNSICFVEYKGIRAVRAVKKLDNTKVLLLNNSRGDVRTETLNIKDIKPLGKLLKLEITLKG